jgi:hypothetical protein
MYKTKVIVLSERNSSSESEQPDQKYRGAIFTHFKWHFREGRLNKWVEDSFVSTVLKNSTVREVDF